MALAGSERPPYALEVDLATGVVRIFPHSHLSLPEREKLPAEKKLIPDNLLRPVENFVLGSIKGDESHMVSPDLPGQKYLVEKGLHKIVGRIKEKYPREMLVSEIASRVAATEDVKRVSGERQLAEGLVSEHLEDLWPSEREPRYTKVEHTA